MHLLHALVLRQRLHQQHVAEHRLEVAGDPLELLDVRLDEGHPEARGASVEAGEREQL
ncbi:hypothetical protein [Nannocystis pusilla]|uniref:hypothetical protein n=1 Tax=Nannocystis pusilla TaxID=889268 RepID=UPI003B7B5EF8